MDVTHPWMIILQLITIMLSVQDPLVQSTVCTCFVSTEEVVWAADVDV